MNDTYTTENVTAMTISEGLRADDLDDFLHVFRAFDWIPRLSLPGNSDSVRPPALTFSTSEGTVLQISKNDSGNFDLKFGFEDPQHPEGRFNAKLDGATDPEVEEAIQVFCSDSKERKRDWCNTAHTFYS